MYWTLELASYLEDAPWPASKDELIDFAIRTGAQWRLQKTFKILRTKEKSMRASKKFGLTTLQEKTSYSTKTSIKDFLS